VATRPNAAAGDDVYELPPVESVDDIPDVWQSPATYTLEMNVRCPHCDERIRTIRIVGLSRSQVAFTSTLPRKGRVAVCPECDAILPVELSGLL
jgi:DNA-directed RNA polymerase subunit RPC12/RpoP